MALNLNTDLALIDTNTNSGTITLPASATSQGRVLTFKDIQGTFGTNTLTLICDGSDTFEDNSTSKILRESYGSIQIVASDTKWFLLNGTQVNTVQTSTLIADSISSFNISTINANISTLQFIDDRFSTNVLNISTAFLSTQNVSTNFLYYNNYVIAGTRIGYSNVLNRFSFSSIRTVDLILYFEANNIRSYPGSGTTWINLGTGGSTYNATLAGSSGLPRYIVTPVKTFEFTLYQLTTATSYLLYNYMSLTRPPTIGDDFTFCAWIKTTNVGFDKNHYQLMYIISTEIVNVVNDFGFGIDNNGKLAYGDGKLTGTDITIRTTQSVNTGNWVFVAVTRTKSTGAVVLYINGIAVISGTCNSGNTLNAATLILIGAEQDSIGNTMGGSIAAILGYTSALSPQDILNNFNVQKVNYGF